MLPVFIVAYLMIGLLLAVTIVSEDLRKYGLLYYAITWPYQIYKYVNK